MNNTQTPETDALDCELHNPKLLSDRYSAMRDHACRLEQERNEAVAGLKLVANWSGGTDLPHHIVAGDILDCLNFKNKEAAK